MSRRECQRRHLSTRSGTFFGNLPPNIVSVMFEYILLGHRAKWNTGLTFTSELLLSFFGHLFLTLSSLSRHVLRDCFFITNRFSVPGYHLIKLHRICGFSVSAGRGACLFGSLACHPKPRLNHLRPPPPSCSHALISYTTHVPATAPSISDPG